MKTFKTIAVGLTLGLLLAGSVLAITGSEMLTRVQAALKPGSDQTITERMTITKADGRMDVLQLKIYRKGDRALLRVLSPADYAGIGLLVLPKTGGGDDIWLYLPAFRDVKQIVAEGLSEGFVGSDFAYEDLTLRYTDKYEVTGMSEGSEQHVLTLAPKPGAQVSYSQASMWASPDHYLPSKVEFERGGEVVKRMTLSEVEAIGAYLTPRRIEMVNAKTESRTEIALLEVQYDSDLEDDLFTVRNLKRR